MQTEKILKMETRILFYGVSLFVIILGFSNLLVNKEILYVSKSLRSLCMAMFFLLENSIGMVTTISIIVVLGWRLKKLLTRKNEKGIVFLKEHIYRQYFDTISDGIIAFSPDKVILMNANGKQVIEDNMLLSDDACSIQNNKNFKELMNMVFESTESLDISSYKIVNSKKEEHYYHVKTFTDYYENKRIGFVILKEIEHPDNTQIITEYTESMNLDNTKFEILNKISHELRTPINILQGVLYNSINTVEEIQDGIIKEKLMRDISIYDRNIRRILKLSNSFIGLMEMSTSVNSLYFQNCDIINIIKSLSEASKEYAIKKSRKIEFISEAEELFCAVDVDKFEKMVLNLLSNAIKFSTVNSKIRIKVVEKDRELKIDVCSTGEIIEEEQLENIFKLFNQGEHLLTRSNEGLGLGLRFVKQYAEMHGGKVEVKTLDRETKFSVRIPIRIYDNLQQVDSAIEAEICKQKVMVEFSDI